MFSVNAKINFDEGFKTKISYKMIDFITKGMQSFEMNAYLLLINAPLTVTLIVGTLSRLIYKSIFAVKSFAIPKNIRGNFL